MWLIRKDDHEIPFEEVMRELNEKRNEQVFLEWDKSLQKLENALVHLEKRVDRLIDKKEKEINSKSITRKLIEKAQKDKIAEANPFAHVPL